MAKRVLNESITYQGSNVRMTIKAEPITFELDPIVVGEEPAHAMRDAIADGIRAITASASTATQVYRDKARKAVARGAAWATERYEGRAAPTGSRLFNASGELANGVQLQRTAQGYEVTAPHLDPHGGDAASMVERLRSLVAALRDPFSDPRVMAAVEKALAKVATVTR